MSNIKLYNDDCINRMKYIDGNSIDLILCDMPYGTTKNNWDSVLPLETMWNELKRIIKKRGCIALFAQTPFDKILGASNIDMLKYEWIWEKPTATGHLNSRFAPMKCHENILIFSESASCFVKDEDMAMTYNPQIEFGKPYNAKSGKASTNYDASSLKSVVTQNDGTRMPRDIITFNRDNERLHPTQKPIALLEYLIKTYTNDGDVVLDFCMGSGSTGIACINTNRDFIGIELDENYFNIASNRINERLKHKELF